MQQLTVKVFVSIIVKDDHWCKYGNFVLQVSLHVHVGHARLVFFSSVVNCGCQETNGSCRGDRQHVSGLMECIWSSHTCLDVFLSLSQVKVFLPFVLYSISSLSTF